jgi:transposase-like protein
MYFQGVSTRKVQEVLEVMCGGEISSGAVSRVAMELDERLSEFRGRGLSSTEYPYVKIDARYEKVRVEGQVVSQAVLVTVGFRGDGRREVLDWRVADSESEATWGQMFRQLKDRGLHGVVMVVSDAHQGIRKALERHFQGVRWQRCQVHFKRELAGKVSAGRRKAVLEELAVVLHPQERGECLSRGQEMASRWEGRYPGVARMLREGLEECLSVLWLPSEHRRRMTSTNMVENVMKRLKARTRVVGVFPNRASCDRMVGALLVELHEAWAVEDKVYFDMEYLRRQESAREADGASVEAA